MGFQANGLEDTSPGPSVVPPWVTGNIMSMGIYPVFKPELDTAEFDGLGYVLLANLGTLNEIAESAKLTHITHYADNRPIPEDFEGDPDELAEIMGEWTDWFDPNEGKRTVQALVDHLKASRRAAKRLARVQDIIAELEAMARMLAVASLAGVRFRLKIH